MVKLRKFLNPRSAKGFESLFANEGCLEYTKTFLNAMLKLNGEEMIASLEIPQLPQFSRIQNKRPGQIDFIVSDKSKERYIIELYMSNGFVQEKHRQRSAMQVYVSGSEKWKYIRDISKIIYLTITDYHLTLYRDIPFRSFYVPKDNINISHINGVDNFQYVFIELPKFKKSIRESIDSIEYSWIYFLKYGKETDEPIMELYDLPHIKNAYDKLNSKNLSNAQLIAYEYGKNKRMKYLDRIHEVERRDIEQMENFDIKYAIGDLRKAGNTKKRIAEFFGIKVSKVDDIPIPGSLEELILMYHEVGHDAERISSFTSLSEELVSLLIERNKSRKKY